MLIFVSSYIVSGWFDSKLLAIIVDNSKDKASETTWLFPWEIWIQLSRELDKRRILYSDEMFRIFKILIIFVFWISQVSDECSLQFIRVTEHKDSNYYHSAAAYVHFASIAVLFLLDL